MSDEHQDAWVIRSFADGELDGDAAAEVASRAAADADLAARVRFDQALRERVKRALAGPNAAVTPPELTARVRRTLIETRTEVGSSAIAPRDHRSWWIGPQRANVFAVAATLAVIAGAVLFSLFGPTIDQLSQPEGGSLASRALEWVWVEHESCASDAIRRLDKARWLEPSDARLQLASWLGTSEVPVADLSAVGYEFVGAGPCHVPGADRSGHLIYRKAGCLTETERAPSVSVFLVADAGQFGELSTTFQPGDSILPFEPPEEICSHLRVRSDGRCVWILVCCNEKDIPRIEAAVAAGCP